MKYTASSGDSWDSISWKSFDDEWVFPQLMENNRKFSDVLIFEGGESVEIPDQVYVENAIISSPWQTGTKIAVITTPWG
jgi:hypothetical protein